MMQDDLNLLLHYGNDAPNRAPRSRLRKNVWTIPNAERDLSIPVSVAPPSTAYTVELKGASQFQRLRGFTMRSEHQAREELLAKRKRTPTAEGLFDRLPGSENDTLSSPRRRNRGDATEGRLGSSTVSGAKEAVPTKETSPATLSRRGVTIPRGPKRSESDTRAAGGSPPPGHYNWFKGMGDLAMGRKGGKWSRRDRFEVDREAAATPGPGFYNSTGSPSVPLSRAPGVTMAGAPHRHPTRAVAVTPGPGDYDLPPLSTQGGGVETLSMPSAVFLASRIAHDPSIRDAAFLADLRLISQTAQVIGRHQLLSRLA